MQLWCCEVSVFPGKNACTCIDLYFCLKSYVFIFVKLQPDPDRAVSPLSTQRGTREDCRCSRGPSLGPPQSGQQRQGKGSNMMSRKENKQWNKCLVPSHVLFPDVLFAPFSGWQYSQSLFAIVLSAFLFLFLTYMGIRMSNECKLFNFHISNKFFVIFF